MITIAVITIIIIITIIKLFIAIAIVFNFFIELLISIAFFQQAFGLVIANLEVDLILIHSNKSWECHYHPQIVLEKKIYLILVFFQIHQYLNCSRDHHSR